MKIKQKIMNGKSLWLFWPETSFEKHNTHNKMKYPSDSLSCKLEKLTLIFFVVLFMPGTQREENRVEFRTQSAVQKEFSVMCWAGLMLLITQPASSSITVETEHLGRGLHSPLSALVWKINLCRYTNINNLRISHVFLRAKAPVLPDLNVNKHWLNLHKPCTWWLYTKCCFALYFRCWLLLLFPSLLSRPGGCVRTVMVAPH